MRTATENPAASPTDSQKEGADLDLRSPVGLIALMRLSGNGWLRMNSRLATLRIALLCPTIAPYLDGDRTQWEEALEFAGMELARCEEEGVKVVSIFDEAYPERLRFLPNPPPVLYVSGEVSLLNRARTAALLGAAQQTPVGITTTKRIAMTLAEAGWTLVGNLIDGVESFARDCAHATGSPTITVSGGGLKSPSLKRELAEKISCSGGALISALPLEDDGSRQQFENARFASAALSVASLIPDVRLTNYMRQSVQMAVRQGRPVLCVKHPVEGDGDRNSDSRTLLELPAKEIPQTSSAWRDQRFLEMLGDLPLAEEAPEDPQDLLLRLERAVSEELGNALPPKRLFGLQQEQPLLEEKATIHQLRADAGL